MSNQVVNHDALKAITGYKRTPDILKCLKNQGIQCFVGKKGTWTTIGLIEKAGITSENNNNYVDIV